MMKNIKQRVTAYRLNRKKAILAKQRGTPFYKEYYFSGKENFFYGSISCGIVLFFSYFFYRSFYSVFFFFFIGVLTYLSFQKEKGSKQRQKLEEEFKDCIMSVSANLRAGYSIENAFMESSSDIFTLYGEEGLMIKELRHMKKGLQNNVPLEQLLQEFGVRSESDNIREFSEVFFAAKQSGGNLPEIMQATAQLISERISLKQDITVIISGRVFEQKIMNIIPFLLITYVEMGNPGFFDVLYHNITGFTIMTGCLFIYLLAYAMAEKSCRISL